MEACTCVRPSRPLTRKVSTLFSTNNRGENQGIETLCN